MPKKRVKKTARYVPYARGFKLPSKDKQIKAIGYPDAISIPEEFNPKSFKPVKKCVNLDDWLAQYNEEGQTCAQYKQQCPWLSWRKEKFITQTFVKDGATLTEKYPNGKIYILPLGNSECFPDVDELIDYTRKFLRLPVEKITGVNLEIEKDGKEVYVVYPETSNNNVKKRKQLLHTRFNRSGDGTSHFQINVTSCLQTLRANIPGDALCVVALTMCDLYQDKPDLFVAGMAAGNHRVAIFSLSRYDPNLTFSGEFWYDIQRLQLYDEVERRKIMLQRGCRLLVHEINHILGFAHCVFYDCCMNGSGHLEEDFSQPMHLCPVDLRKLQTLVGFDIVQRYRDLESFCTKHGFVEEVAWYKRRIKSITKEKK